MTRGEPQRPYKQVARAKAQERTRETLLQAATEEVERDRWTEASLEEVAGRAGVSKQTALRHFGSKQGLLDAVIRRTSSIVIKERDEAPVGDIAGAVANLVHHYERYGDIVIRMLPYRDAVVRVMGTGHRNPLVRAADRGHEVHEHVGHDARSRRSWKTSRPRKRDGDWRSSWRYAMCTCGRSCGATSALKYRRGRSDAHGDDRAAGRTRRGGACLRGQGKTQSEAEPGR